MDTHTLVRTLADRIDADPSVTARTWAWTYATHAVALAHLIGADPSEPSDATWVEPQLAWALDALADAGIPANPFLVRAADPLTPVADVLATLLHHLLQAATTPQPGEPPAHAEARAYTARRAQAALRALDRARRR
jgi:hypothetical protein